jgi:hypothetical protein
MEYEKPKIEELGLEVNAACGGGEADNCTSGSSALATCNPTGGMAHFACGGGTVIGIDCFAGGGD